MNRAAVISAAHIKMCVDCDQIGVVCPEHSNMSEVLVDWQAFKREEGAKSNPAPLFTLTELLGLQTETVPETKRLIILRDAKNTIGLIVTQFDQEIEVTDEQVSELPKAFSSSCRACMPLVVISGKNVYPVITPASVLAMAERAEKPSFA